MESGCHHAFSPADGAVINALLSASLLFSEAFRNDFSWAMHGRIRPIQLTSRNFPISCLL
jgi:hypothetical protein